jgi:hypothetical protein
MATTTPNYGWTVPTSTDLVKDGATAIETLGDAIDASMNTALGTKKAGMVLLNTTSFSAVSSITVNSIFSSSYANYLVYFDFTSSVNLNATLQYTIAGTATATNYNVTGPFSTLGNITGAWYPSTNTSSILIGDTAGLNTVVADIARPQVSGVTNFIGKSTEGNGAVMLIGSVQTGTNSFDGLKLTASSGSITGKIITYGYNV